MSAPWRLARTSASWSSTSASSSWTSARWQHAGSLVEASVAGRRLLPSLSVGCVSAAAVQHPQPTLRLQKHRRILQELCPSLLPRSGSLSCCCSNNVRAGFCCSGCREQPPAPAAAAALTKGDLPKVDRMARPAQRGAATTLLALGEAVPTPGSANGIMRRAARGQPQRCRCRRDGGPLGGEVSPSCS